MCGRFSMSIDSDDLQTALALGQMPADWWLQHRPCSLSRRATLKATGRMVAWGLVPFGQDPTIGAN